ncbi:hypothetical protein BX666DRAFT_1997264 [Dichotomocladium elegans]|nr:hypothetical protein BX666DRAFT_1997264 [Dichotomocladium elegans]
MSQRQFGSRSVRSFQHLHNRSALLGDSGARGGSPLSHLGSRSSSPANSLDGSKPRLNDQDLELLESQSEERINGLSSKVQLLKSITGKIGDEIRSSNSLLETMNTQFSDTGSVLDRTMHNFKVMAAKENGVTMCFLIFFIVVMVIVSYYWFFR